MLKNLIKIYFCQSYKEMANLYYKHHKTNEITLKQSMWQNM